MLTAFLDRLKGRAVEKHESKRLSYDDLTHQAASEFSEADGEDVEQIVSRYLDHLDRLGLGKPDDVSKFEKDVKLIVKRLELSGIHSTGDEAYARVEGLAATIKHVQQDYQAELDIVRRKYDAELFRLNAEMTQAQSDKRKADNAGNTLRQCAPTLAVERLNKANTELLSARQQIEHLRQSNGAGIASLKDRLAWAKKGFRYYLSDPPTLSVLDPAICRSMRDNHARVREQKRKQIADMEAQLAELIRAQPSPELYQAVKDAEAKVAEAEAALLLP